jgi:hypothetical protein
VHRPQMVEGRAAAEVLPLDQRHRQPTLRGVIRRRQAMNPAANHQQVEGVGRQPIQIATHAWIVVRL